MTQQVLAERPAGAEHAQQPHGGALVADEAVDECVALLDAVREVGEQPRRLVGVRRRGEQVHELTGRGTEPLERRRGPVRVLEPEPGQSAGGRRDPAGGHRGHTSAGPAPRRDPAQTAAKASASSRHVARRSSRAATTSPR
jgi:hypothetical protein